MNDEQEMQAGNLLSDSRNDPRGWYSRGYLPHFDGGEVTQFITFRLADSLPVSVLNRYKVQLEQELITEIEFHKKIDRYLDNGGGAKYLQNASIAEIVEENLLRFDGERYKLFHWVIMANHIHILLSPNKGVSLESIMHSMKSFTANRANKMLGRSGKFWSPEYFDRYIRDSRHFENTVAYIHSNPVKAGLCSNSSDWRFGCARNHE